MNSPNRRHVRHVHRAAADLRRGLAVPLRAQNGVVTLLAAETTDPAALEQSLRAAAGRPILILSRSRADALRSVGPGQTEAGADIVAFLIAEQALDVALLGSLADPTLPQQAPGMLRSLLTEVPVPDAGGECIALAKIARLLPAVLVVACADDPAGPAVLDPADIIAYPHRLNAGLRRVANAEVPMDHAPDARVVAFRPHDGAAEHLAIVVGQPALQRAPLVRIHSACLTGDLFGSLRCDCGPQLRGALARMHAEGGGVLLYMAQEGRGIGLVNKLRAYAIQDGGQDTADANLSLGFAVDERSFEAAAIMLDQLGIRRVRLLTNNPAKLAALTAYGIEVERRESHVIAPNGVNDAYLLAKTGRLGHLPE